MKLTIPESFKNKMKGWFAEKKEQLKEFIPTNTWTLEADKPPTPSPQFAQPTPTPQPAFDSTNHTEIERKMRQGLREYSQKATGGKELPVERYIPKFMEAVKKYDFFKKNPFLLPQIAILETSGGKYITRPNNLLNWGINYPGNNQLFAQMNMDEVLDRAISGIGERSPYYNEIRKTNDLQKFAETYEPSNKDYYRSLKSGMDYFSNL